MMFEFKSLKDLILHFSDEQVCRDYLEQKRWNGEPFCPHCGNTKVATTYQFTPGKVVYNHPF